MGGNVFKGKTDSIKRENIEPTLASYFGELAKVFSKNKKIFNTKTFQPVGSVGKKPISGDIDLAVDASALFDKDMSQESLDRWGINRDDVLKKADELKKRARTASESQIKTRAFLILLANKINEVSQNIYCDTDKVTHGNIFTLYPQIDTEGNNLGIGVQIDWMIGNIDWLRFSYYSNTYSGNVKGLHRTQLMLSLFTNLGLIFNHASGVKDKATNEVIATNPKEAIAILNDRYKFDGKLTEDTLSDYFKLYDFLEKNLDKETFNHVLDIYLKILDSTRADIPENLQKYWRLRKADLGLTGKFLPQDSKLLESYTFKQFLKDTL